ncbi:hypothetical protein D3C80_1536640 [compost metagenome]
MAHRDQEIFTHEEMGFAVLDFVLAPVPLCGFHHDKQRIAVGFEFGALVGTQCILNRQIMQAKLFLHLAHKGVLRLPQPKPDEGVRLFDDFADVINGHFTQPFTGFVRHAVHNHGCGFHQATCYSGRVLVSK